MKRYLTALAFSLLPGTTAMAAGLGDSMNTATRYGKEMGYSTIDKAGLLPMIGSIIQIVLSLLGVIFIILAVYAGYLWMMARGDKGSVQKSKDILQAAVIGIIIIVSSYAISTFVINKLTATTIKDNAGYNQSIQ